MRATILSAALAICPTVGLAEDWWVVVGYFDHPPLEWDDGILKQGQDLEADLSGCNMRVFWDFAGKFEGFNTDSRGTVFVVDTPKALTELEAEELAEAAALCVPDAYSKTARYFGE